MRSSYNQWQNLQRYAANLHERGDSQTPTGSAVSTVSKLLLTLMIKSIGNRTQSKCCKPHKFGVHSVQCPHRLRDRRKYRHSRLVCFFHQLDACHTFNGQGVEIARHITPLVFLPPNSTYAEVKSMRGHQWPGDSSGIPANFAR